MNLLVFLFSIPIRLEGFSLIDLVSFLLYLLGLKIYNSGIWFFFLIFLFDRQKVFSPIPQKKYQILFRNYVLNEACADKEGNCNFIAI